MSDGSDFDEDDVSGEQEEGEHLEENEEELPEKPLIQEMIPECLSLLCKIGTGLAHAYVRLDCHQRDLTDIEHIKKFIHVRYIDISGNLLKDISSLNHLTHLLTLNTSKNNLTSAKLDALPYLQIADFSGNKITSTEGIEHPQLEKLNLNSNQITQVTGLYPKILSNLHRLELRANRLQDTTGIDLPNLRELYLAGNGLKKIEGLENLVNLEKLHLRDNQIEKLDGFSETMKKLQYVNLRSNTIANLKELNKMVCLPILRALVLNENPCLEDDGYRIEVLIMLRRLERLDKEEYSDEDRAEAEDISEQRRQEELLKENEAEDDNEENDG
ncbi:unnamed protein product [Clavelina lepadiformis]|uniref:Leucine-rich repeat-containing protein 23 n=1 Tax=Clavelina lepadiformis TaxID=159417 RepID=A0ABP0FPD6_CLALP